MLSPQPSYDNDYSTTAPNASTLFSGVDNVAAPGAPVPLIYGEHLVGSSVVSSQYKTL
ncbi:Phage-related protein, tail component (plasmid) [Piscirickettsia salmonis]|nr:Phage-related protein, tail component [Piscirickettsia salmonis]QGP61997.1 Phage-related protein, tail component [Piscirickettsia salmonis]QGP66836.1 Phage-related protein, tail component [Piscirickettsia salmonis]